jgi:sulfite exporter TauE/SafE
LKEEVSAAALLSIAVTLLTMGTSLVQQQQYVPGCVCLITGVALIFATVLLVERGVIQRVARKLREWAREVETKKP